MQSADQVEANGSHVSTAGFKTGPWYRIQCPTTVLAALVKAGEYEDLYVGTNLSTIPRARFEQCWWYRCEFDVTDICEVETTLLEFDGINYGANIYVNGRLIANARQVHGAFRRFCFDISKWVHQGVNVLAVEVSPPRPGDFSTGFVDWNPPSPDLNMGIFRPVTLRGCQSISIDNPFVQVDLDTETLDKADLTVSAELCNHGNRPVTGVLRGSIESICFEQTVTLRAGQQIKVEFTPAEYRELHVLQPRIWWPHDLGEPNLYELNLDFYVDEVVSDTCQTRFGMRQVEDYFNEAGHRGFKINGRQVLIRAGGWTDDMLLADTPEKLQAQIQYVKHMNLNCIRLEGFWGTDHTLYDLCDAYGILIMVGWSCHWEHEQYLGKPVDNRFGGVASPGDIELIAKSWRDQVVWLRNHASVFAWTVASDKVPHPDLERRYIEIFEQYDATRPYLASTGGVGSEQAIIGTDVVVSDLSGPTGVKMLGPYAYTPPIYWYEDTERGGAYGFNTETGPGAQVPVLSSLKQMLPADKRWPINEGWHFHCGLNEFATLDRTCQALEKRYGPSNTLEAFAQKAQVLNYELIRPMFEAFRVQKGRATGIVQWMLNAAWPKMYWQLYDWYLMPTGAFYGTKKACEPVQLIYNYAKRSIHLVNDAPHAYENLSVHIRVLDLHARDIFLHSLEANAAPLSSQALLTLPECPDITQTSFLD
ncbi:MAG: glycoside hydrolase family 2, partial [Phycisphaeraceae bacterium]|nr:glycoside hydrolase family 2 [Phycisphaeraceae bacterium]